MGIQVVGSSGGLKGVINVQVKKADGTIGNIKKVEVVDGGGVRKLLWRSTVALQAQFLTAEQRALITASGREDPIFSRVVDSPDFGSALAAGGTSPLSLTAEGQPRFQCGSASLLTFGVLQGSILGNYIDLIFVGGGQIFDNACSFGIAWDEDGITRTFILPISEATSSSEGNLTRVRWAINNGGNTREGCFCVALFAGSVSE